MRVKKLFLGLLCCLALWQIPQAAAAEPQIGAKAAIVMDIDTGQVLWQQNAYAPLPPASTTKVLTNLVSLQMTRQSQVYTVSEQAAQVGEATVYLKPGEQYTVLELEKASLMRSANDASFALGEATAGSEPNFVHWMNLKAWALGAYGVTAANTNGLPNEQHQMRAYDLALISRYAMLNHSFAAIVGTKYDSIGQGSAHRELKNTNRLLWQDPNILGGKTGTTVKAGPCLVAAMARDGRRVVAVVLNSPNRYRETMQLLDYGVDNFVNIKVCTKGETIAILLNGQKCVAQASGIYTLAKADAAKLQVKMVPTPSQGARFGYLQISCLGKILGRIDVLKQNN